MPGIHLPALQGIAGLKPVNITAQIPLDANTALSQILFTVPEDKILLLTYVGVSVQGSNTLYARMSAEIPNMSYIMYLLDIETPNYMDLATKELLVFLPPATKIGYAFATGNNSGAFLPFISGAYFDYFGED
jgi:hypothetical protein